MDLVSDGRVELGLGEGSSVTELHPFKRRFRDKRDVWEDAVRAMLPMFWNDAWEYDGEYFEFPKRNVIPKPLQKPHPPLWVACSQLDTIIMAGRRGMGALAFAFLNPDAAQAWVNAYYNEYTKRMEKLCDYKPNAGIAVVAGFMCSETDEEAEAKADGWTFFQFALRFYNKYGPIDPGTVNLWDEYQKWKESPEGLEGAAVGVIGSPETVRNKLLEFEACHVDQVILLNQAGKNTHEDICDSLKLFAKEVMPEFHGREPEHQKWKRKVLAGEIQLDEIDTAPHEIAGRQKPSQKPGSAPSLATGKW